MIGMGFTNLEHPWPTEVTHIRIWDIGCTWRDIHTAPDTYNWDRLDAVVAKAAGRHLTYVIAATPKWLAKHPDQPHFAPWLGAGSNSMPHSVDEFNKFVWQLATRYKGRIKAYEVWNEPQLADFMFPYNDAECNTLATMQQRAYHTIKSIDPAAVVLSASVLPRTSSGGMNKARRYLTALKRKGWNCDAFACHLSSSFKALTVTPVGASSTGTRGRDRTSAVHTSDLIPQRGKQSKRAIEPLARRLHVHYT